MLGRQSFLIVATSYLADILGFISITILSKLWGSFAPEALGVIGFAISFISLFGIVTDLGFSSAHIKRVSEGKDLGVCIGTFVTVKLILTSVMVASIFISIFIWKNILHGDFYDATTESVIIVIVIYSIFTSLQDIAIQTFTGRREIAKLQTTRLFENIVKLPLTVIIALAGVMVMGRAISPAVAWPEFLQPLQRFLAEHATGSLAMTYVFGVMATFFVGMWLMRGYPIKKPSISSIKNYLRFSMPLAISSVISTAATNIGTVMIGYFWASADVGYYFAFQRIIAFITVLYVSVATVLFPTISKKYAEKDTEGAVKTALLADRYISMILIPPLAFSLIFAKPAINIILDASFLPGSLALVFLVIFAFIKGMTTSHGNLVMGMGRSDVSAKLGISVCVVNIILNYLFIPENGLLSHIELGGFTFVINGAAGAAFATSLSFLIPFFGYRIAAKKMAGMKIFQNNTLCHIVAGIVMSFVLYYIAYGTSLFPVIRWYTLIGFAGVGLAIYIAILYILREFKKEDLHFFLNILRPKEMLSYVKSELKEKKQK